VNLYCERVTELGAPIAERLAEALWTGTLLDLIPEAPKELLLDEAEMRGWDASHDVEGALLRDLLRRRCGGDPDPRGLRLRGARICGRLDLDFVDTTVALRLTDCLLEDGMSAEHARLPVLSLIRCHLGQHDRPALAAERLRVDGPLDLHGSVITSEGAEHAATLIAAHVSGQLRLSGATVCNPTGPALDADGLRTDGSMYMDEGFTAQGSGEDGTIRLAGAQIGGQLRLSGATVHNPTGPAVTADRMRSDGGVFLDGGFTVEGAGHLGAVCLLAVRVGAQLSACGATVRNRTGPAVNADGLQANGDVFFDEGFTARGAGDDGAVRLLAAQIGGQLRLSGATVRNRTGPAVVADGLQASGDVFFDEGFTARGAGDDGAVSLHGAQIGGQLTLSGATVRNHTGPAIIANHLQTHESMFLDDGFTAEGGGDDGAVCLAGARIGGRFYADGSVVTSRTTPALRWEFDGLTYSGVPLLADTKNREAWLDLLRNGTPSYAAQPYQQLAAAYRADGHDSDVRAVLMAQRRDQVDRGGLGWADQWWARITGVLLGYGYQPWRALFLLAGILATSVMLSWELAAHGALIRGNQSNVGPPAATKPVNLTLEDRCPLIDTIGHGLDIGTPFLPRATSCKTTTGATGVALTVSTWALQLAAWALAALFVAGFTGIVRKT